MKRILLTILSIWSTVLCAQSLENWTATGPIAFPTNLSGQINGMGRLTQFKFHPTNAAKMYTTAATGGLWLSSDTGNTWVKTGTDNLPITSCASVCIDYTNDQILYLGTGDPNYYSPGYGVWKSVDGGKTWNMSANGMGFRLVVEILMDPRNHNNLIAATNSGIWKSTDAGATWVVKKVGGEFTDMIFKPKSPTNTIYATTKTGFWKSTDMGDTWTTLTLPGDVNGFNNGGRIGVTKADSNLVFLTYVGIANYRTPILKSTNSGQSFTVIKAANAINYNSYERDGSGGGQENYNYDMCMDPFNANTLYIAGHIVWKSTDGGLTWTNNHGWWEGIHTDMHQIDVSPYNSAKLFNANDGGLWLSKNQGGTWVTKCQGLSVTECYHAGQSPLSRDSVYIGTQDNGELFYNGTSWNTNRGGDWGSRIVVDYSSAGTAYYLEDHTSDYSLNGSRRAFNNGGEWLNFPFNAGDDVSMIFSSSQSNLAFISKEDVYITNNLLSSPPTWTKITNLAVGIRAIAISPTDNNVLYVITNDNRMFRSDNALAATPTFTTITLPSGATTGNKASITVLKSNTNIVYITCDAKVFRSANKGGAWTDVTYGLLPVNLLKIHSDDFKTDESVYIGSAMGVYYKNSSMTSWLNYSKGLPSVANISDFMIYNKVAARSALRVSYYGRGVWESPLYSATPVQVGITSPASVSYLLEGNVTFTCTATTSSGSINKVEYYSGNTLIGTVTASPWSFTWTNVTSGIYTITAKAYTTTSLTGVSPALEKLTILKLRDADNPTNTSSGLNYKYYEGSFSSVAALDEVSPLSTGTGTNFSLAPRLVDDNFGFTFNGYIQVPTDGIYTFYTASDDGSVLYIGETPVVGNDGFHGSTEKSGVIGLKAGKHIIKVAYFEGGGDNTLDVYYSGPSITKQLVPNSVLFIGNQPPTVSITAPANNTGYPAPASIIINASAADADGTVSKVDFYNGTTLLGTDNTFPYSYTWVSVAAGSYSLTAKATDNASAVTTSSVVNVTVTSGNQFPTVSITAPVNNATFTAPASITITATAADADGTVSKVDFYNGTTLLGTDNTSPYSFAWTSVATGSYSLTAKATDNANAVTTSSVITLVVSSSNQAPTVSITAPANNATYTAPASVTITATATDADGTISKVDFYNGTTLLGTDNTSPYSYAWTSVAAGTYSLTAKATDNLNAVTTSSVISITVTTTSTADIIGPDCGSNNASLAYELNATKQVNATSYNWWYTGSGTLTAGAQPYRTTLTTGTSFSAGQLCVGVNYSGSPYYQQYCKSITVCSGSKTASNLSEIENSSKLSVYPNPAAHVLNVKYESQEEGTIRTTLTDASSRILMEKQGSVIIGQNAFDLNLNTVKNGEYVLTIYRDNGTVSTKVVVNK